MISIALFDTDSDEQYQLDDMISAAMFSYDDCEISFYTSYSLFSADLIDGRRSFDLLFVNISDENKAGVLAAEFARNFSSIIEIILVGKDYSGFKFGYKLKALDYILKPYQRSQIKEAIERFYDFYNKDACFTFKNGHSIEKVRLNNILYFCSNGRKVVIVSVDREQIEFYGKLDDVAALLMEKQFIRVHQSYFVNVKLVKSISKDRLFMINSEEIPVSRTRYEEIKNMFCGI